MATQEIWSANVKVAPLWTWFSDLYFDLGTFLQLDHIRQRLPTIPLLCLVTLEGLNSGGKCGELKVSIAGHGTVCLRGTFDVWRQKLMIWSP